jgi:hypothetical protein
VSGEEVRKVHGSVNIVQILCIHAYKWKKCTETIPGVDKGNYSRIKENGRGG